MPSFSPAPDGRLELDVEGTTRRLRALPHPAAAVFVHAMEGAKGRVYHLRDEESGADCALKVMKTRFREPSLAMRCAALDGLKALPGMAVCERVCLTQRTSPAALARYHDLEFAILMPWVDGLTWCDLLQQGAGGSALRTAGASLAAAASLAATLARLESLGVAHCDLSAGNIILGPAARHVALVDVEDVFTPALPPPASVPAGTPGYQHRTGAEGNWRADGDRFAGAVLLAELIGWHDPAVRRTAYGESYFDPGEVQDPSSERLRVLAEALRGQANGAALAALLDRAWASRTPGECPALAEWRLEITRARMGVSYTGRAIAAASPPRRPVAWEAPVPLPSHSPEHGHHD